jgi:hypothetical protein
VSSPQARRDERRTGALLYTLTQVAVAVPLPVDDPVAEGVPRAERDAAGEALVEGEATAERVLEKVVVAVLVPAGDFVVEGEGDSVRGGDADFVDDGEGVPRGEGEGTPAVAVGGAAVGVRAPVGGALGDLEAAVEREGCGERDAVSRTVPVAGGDGVRGAEREGAPEALRAPEGEPGAVDVPEAVPPPVALVVRVSSGEGEGRGDGESERESMGLREGGAESEAVAVPARGEREPTTVAEGGALPLRVGTREVVAFSERDGLGEAEMEGHRDAVGEGRSEGGGARLELPRPDAMALRVDDGEGAGEREGEALRVARDAEAERVLVALREALLEIDAPAASPAEGVASAEGVRGGPRVAVASALRAPARVPRGEAEREEQGEGVRASEGMARAERDASGERVEKGDGDAGFEAKAERVLVALREALLEIDAPAASPAEGVASAEGVRGGPRVAVASALRAPARVPRGEAEKEEQGEGVRASEGMARAERDASGERVEEGDGDAGGEAEGKRDARVDAEGDWLGVYVPGPEGAAPGERCGAREGVPRALAIAGCDGTAERDGGAEGSDDFDAAGDAESEKLPVGVRGAERCGSPLREGSGERESRGVGTARGDAVPSAGEGVGMRVGSAELVTIAEVGALRVAVCVIEAAGEPLRERSGDSDAAGDAESEKLLVGVRGAERCGSPLREGSGERESRGVGMARGDAVPSAGEGVGMRVGSAELVAIAEVGALRVAVCGLEAAGEPLRERSGE